VTDIRYHNDKFRTFDHGELDKNVATTATAIQKYEYGRQLKQEIYPVFGGHIAAFGCRSLLQSLVDTFLELNMVINSRFGDVISILSLIVLESISSLGGYFLLSVIIGIAYKYSLRPRRARSK